MTPYTSPLSTPGTAALMQARQSTTGAQPVSPATAKFEAKAKATAEDFEAVFLNQMFSHMFSGLTGDGPLGGGPGVGVWRSFLTDEYSKSFAKAGGVGIGDQVYRELIARQSSSQPMKAMTVRLPKSNPYAAPTAGATP